ncbi:MAG: glycine zipper family protein [Burkholderiales bacterium]
MKVNRRYAALGAALLLTACVTMPEGPSVMALPGSGKSFDQFRADDYECRQFASSQIGGKSAQQAANESALESAAVGTAIGAAAGALIGGHQGAGAGAGAGLIFGSAAGSGAARGSGRNLQRRYDASYVQCMYAKGDRVPVAGQMQQAPARDYYAPPPPPPPPPPPSR